MNRMLEYKFRDAEMLSVSRMLKGGTYPAKELEALYKRFLVTQFHDILPGSHITPVWRDTIADLTAVSEGLDAIIGTGKPAIPCTIPAISPAPSRFLCRMKRARACATVLPAATKCPSVKPLRR